MAKRKAKKVDTAAHDAVLGVRFQTVPSPTKQDVTVVYVCFDVGPRGTLTARVAASESPAWAMNNGAHVPFELAARLFPHDVTDRANYVGPELGTSPESEYGQCSCENGNGRPHGRDEDDDSDSDDD
jgi:hypothetical protein